jgi:hypothetical protein
MYMISRGGVKDVINDSAMLWNESVSCSWCVICYVYGAAEQPLL